MTRWKTLLLTAAAATAAAAPALADCRGTDYLATLERSSPALVDRLMGDTLRVPYAEGRFWRVEKDGRTSHMFGTFHTADETVATMPPGLVPVIEAARVMLVEVLPEEQDRMQELLARNPALVLNTGGPTLDRILSPGELRGLETLLAGYGMPMQAAVQMQPWFLNMLMATPPCLMEDVMAGEPVLDDRVIEAAQEAGVRVEGLERIEAALEIFQGFPQDQQIRLLQMNIAVGDISEAVTVSTQRLYQDEQIWKIWALNLAMAEALGITEDLAPMIDTFYRRALVDRNRNWLPAIRRALDGGDAVIAVGALHLAGPDSLQAMLEGEGYRFTRLGPDGEPMGPAAATPAPKTPASKDPAAPAEETPGARKTK